MHTTIFGSQFFSGVGAEIHQWQNFTAICATQDIDLATELLPAGDHTITVTVVLGEVHLYLPRHVSVIVDGTVLFGTTNSHDDGKGWKRFARYFSSRSRNGSPVLSYPDTSGNVRLRIRINGVLGSVRIYRLSHEAGAVRPDMVAVGV